MEANFRIYITMAEYLLTERASEVKREYRNGEIQAMPRGNESHNLITANVISILALQLRRRPGKVYPSNLRIKIDQANLYTYADVIVVGANPNLRTREMIPCSIQPSLSRCSQSQPKTMTGAENLKIIAR